MQALFEVGPLPQSEALRKHVADQIPGQIDIWEVCAEAASECAGVTSSPFVWPEPVGALYARADLTGGAVLV
jgi:hypothetical protein